MAGSPRVYSGPALTTPTAPTSSRTARVLLSRSVHLLSLLSVDAHSTVSLGYLGYAVITARRGWARRGEVLNTRGADEFAAAVRPGGGAQDGSHS